MRSSSIKMSPFSSESPPLLHEYEFQFGIYDNYYSSLSLGRLLLLLRITLQMTLNIFCRRDLVRLFAKKKKKIGLKEKMETRSK